MNAEHILTVLLSCNAVGVICARSLHYQFYCCYAHGCKNWLEPWRRGSNLVYGTECPSPSQAIKRYVQHNRNVYDAVPRDRLLVMDIARGDGWDALAPFLGIPVPHNLTFPNRH